MLTCRVGQAQPLINVGCMQSGKMEKEKVVVVMGATGAGKSRLSVDLATCFPAEIINSDKIQAYEGLDIVTNKISKEEQRGVPHHILGTQNPDTDFTALDFRDMSLWAVDAITGRRRLPIIVGGSNSYLEALIDDDDDYAFRSRYEFCCLWVDVAMPVLRRHVADRVEQMLGNGMVEEVRPFFSPHGDYSNGVRRAIGVPEFHRYFRREGLVDEQTRLSLLQRSVSEIKANTCQLAVKQLAKIRRLRNVKRWHIHRLDATPVFANPRHHPNHSWNHHVAHPAAIIVARFLYNSFSSHLRFTPPVMPPATCYT
ncbi:hypothetical protein Fmac_027946 [Flemingia macrophylla]|uniref:adenylate dimethylallyltransferase (ADP/ATP-dependent) n=1 Tax=Flemingia macrophylla TaxID=520843 RepID=A0ABD1LJA7_9FABA